MRLEPPPRDAQCQRYDGLGVALQLVVVSLVLLCRSVLFTVVSCYSAGSPPTWGLAAFLRGIVGVDLLCGATPDDVRAAACLGWATLWLGVEAWGVPHVLEWIRQGPVRLKHLSPSLAQRTETFYVCWWVQAAVLMVSIWVRASGALGPVLAAVALGGRPALRALAMVGATWIASVWLMGVAARATWTLGTAPSRRGEGATAEQGHGLLAGGTAPTAASARPPTRSSTASR